ncbi:SDR family oxidoreductase [Marinobacterium jannaschii]|uniref:SDR family oxidoreductase n=1 Tax=Marinobacterium jannaschii TaxID=64970 RepID=UPI00048A0A2E|nr:SDR family oxidoreductase [Marinobacterium jannaschii]
MTTRTGTVLITGAARGIGLEFVRHYLARGWQVHACARNLAEATELQQLEQSGSGLSLHQLDISSDEQIAELTLALDRQPLDLLINNAGIYGPKKLAFGEVTRDRWRRVLEINTISPLMLTQALIGNLMAGRQKKVLMLSSKVGSISDNSGGAGYYYRSSKTALNQVVKSLSIDLAEKGISVLALHPGWVQTEMGGPNALISTAESVAGLVEVIDALDLQSSGQFIEYNGKQIPW